VRAIPYLSPNISISKRNERGKKIVAFHISEPAAWRHPRRIGDRNVAPGARPDEGIGPYKTAEALCIYVGAAISRPQRGDTPNVSVTATWRQGRAGGYYLHSMGIRKAPSSPTAASRPYDIAGALCIYVGAAISRPPRPETIRVSGNVPPSTVRRAG
jgi:hypothetical protein